MEAPKKASDGRAATTSWAEEPRVTSTWGSLVPLPAGSSYQDQETERAKLCPQYSSWHSNDRFNLGPSSKRSRFLEQLGGRDQNPLYRRAYSVPSLSSVQLRTLPIVEAEIMMGAQVRQHIKTRPEQNGSEYLRELAELLSTAMLRSRAAWEFDRSRSIDESKRVLDSSVEKSGSLQHSQRESFQ